MLLGWSIIGVPLAALVVLGMIFLRPEPISRQLVMGCYVAGRAPDLAIKSDRIAILDESGRFFTYIAEPYKAGYHLTVQPALGLRREATGGYSFVQTRGIGFFWELLPKAPAKRMRAPDQYSGRFEIIADDGTSVVYERSNSSDHCYRQTSAASAH
jgi:hypothetical protein